MLFCWKSSIFAYQNQQINDMKVRAYSKSELAQAYAPDIDGRSALYRLRYWIDFNKDLSRELLISGYRRNQKVFTVRQVELIFHYLGEP